MFYLLFTIIAILAGVALVAMRRPDEFRVSRSTTIHAPAAAVFARINDFHKWDDWSPWAKMDPNATATFSGAPAGVGAGFAWAGNSQVGAGSMTITESHPDNLVRIRLDFEKPMKAVNTAEFTLRPLGQGTRVDWTMTGRNGIPAKLFGLFVDCDKMVGGQFDKGLANLKTLVEAGGA